MTTILQINSAARSQGANSTLLVNELTAKLQQSNPGAQVVVRNLQAEPLPHLDDAMLGAFFTPADQRTPEQDAIAARSEALIAELQAADIVVIGAPMYNFGISSQLKTYFDLIARAGITFQYTANGPEGLVKGKKVIVVSARGGKYQRHAERQPNAVSEGVPRLPRHDRCQLHLCRRPEYGSGRCCRRIGWRA